VLDARKATPRLELERTYDRATALVKEIYTHVPSHDIVVPALLRVHYTDLPAHCRLTPGVPIKVMLGRPSKGFAEIYARWGQRKFSVEFKYDGERAQIHFTEEGKVLVYSRNSENNTQKYDCACGCARLHRRHRRLLLLSCASLRTLQIPRCRCLLASIVRRVHCQVVHSGLRDCGF
jgi:DNA ligase-1